MQIKSYCREYAHCSVWTGTIRVQVTKVIFYSWKHGFIPDVWRIMFRYKTQCAWNSAVIFLSYKVFVLLFVKHVWLYSWPFFISSQQIWPDHKKCRKLKLSLCIVYLREPQLNESVSGETWTTIKRLTASVFSFFPVP